MNLTFTACIACLQTDTPSSNYELYSGVIVAVGKERVNAAGKDNMFCFVLIVLDACIWLSSLFPFPYFFFLFCDVCVIVNLPLNLCCLLKTDGAPRNSAG